MNPTKHLHALLAATALAALPLWATPAKAEAPARKTEMRGVWIATVAGIDWPSQKNDTEAQKKEMLAILDSLKACNINTIAFQVRPTADAFYQSDLEPWSQYLTGRQGLAPAGGFDPLAFVLAEAHARCMEAHVWMNPYRVINGGDTTLLVKDHLYFQRPELFAWYGGKLYFNPAYQDVRDYLTMIVMDIVLRYDLDAIHFDDYFYPYKVAGEEFPDDEAYLQLKGSYTNKADWRRNNVNLVIEQLQHTIKAAKPWVQFGISPFGNNNTNFNELFADLTLWMQNGWIDYALPQLYWNIGHKTVDYARLYDWWQAECRKTKSGNPCNFYVGQYASGLEIYDQEVWKRPNEVVRQLDLNYARGNDQGTFFYSNRYFMRNAQGLLDSLRLNFYRYPALQPSAPNSPGAKASSAPANARIELNRLRWEPVEEAEGLAARYYVVYALPAGSTDSELLPSRIVALTPNPIGDLFLPDYCEQVTPGTRLVVTSFNRYRMESEPSQEVIAE